MKLKFELTIQESDLILAGLHDIERTGWYYGRKDQFDHRLQKLIKMLSEPHPENK